MIKVLLLIDYSSEFDRKLLRGLVRYSKEYGPWIFYRLPSYYTSLYGSEGVIKWAKKWQADAIIGQWDIESVPQLEELQIPIVLQNYHNRSSKYSNLTGDYKKTGQMAAWYFASRNYQNFAYFGVQGVVWSDEREEGFRQEVVRQGGKYFSFELEKDSEDDRELIMQWLQELPKPLAMFCCDDAHALFISETCKICNIAIPDDIALLGVDNDELICNISDPPISSIELEVEMGGYMLGKLLHQRINKEETDTFNIVINPTRIETRLSTDKYDINDPSVRWMVKYIETHFKEELNIEKLISQVPLSRRNFELKFRKYTHTSPYQFLLQCRVDCLAKLLHTTDRLLPELAAEAGFHETNFARVFKKFKGCAPSEYREVHT